MREIKFRARYEVTEKGFIYFTLTDLLKGNIPIFAEDIDFETVGEYTGLKDKNGKEIYEGDILLREMENFYSPETEGKVYYSVFFDITFGKWDIKINPGEAAKWSHPDFFSWNKYEVIGNIYEDKNLLTKD